jgi:TonB family protein
MSPIAKEQEVLTATPESAAVNSQRPSAGDSAVKAQPVALEISVTVNGARTIEGSDKREPFSESTKTVLVLGTGAVIRLSSSVAPGQLLFLTNDKTKKEVVCQVVKSKNFRNVSGYVELEFTESAVGFWGMRFPSDRIGTPAASGTPVAVSAPVLTPMPPAPPKNLEVKPVNTQPVSSTVSVSAEKKIPVAAPPTAAPISNPVGSTSIASNSLKPTDTFSSTNSTALPSASPNSSVLSLPRALDSKPVAPAKPSVPVVLAPVPQTEATPMRRASDQKKADVTPVPITKPFEFSKPDATPVQRAIPTPKSLTAIPSLDLEAEETKIPAWLEPLARNAAAPTSTQELIEREKARHAATVAEVIEPEPLAESIEKESIELKPEAVVSTPSFGAGFLEEDKGISDSASTGGSKKGIFIGVLAAGIALAAGGWWYMQQSRGTHAASTVISAPASTNSNPATTQNNLPTDPASTANLPAASQPVGSSATTTSKPSAAIPTTQNASLAVNPNENPARSTQIATPQTKKPSLGEVRLATPTMNSGAARNISSESAPSLTNEEAVSESMGAGVGLAGGNHKQPVAPPPPAPALPVGGEVKPAKLLNSISPVYPSLAKNQRISGDVRVDALVDAAGKVTAVKVISGPALLQQSAMDAIRGWKYQPATLDGKPVPMHLTVTLQFRLQQ